MACSMVLSMLSSWSVCTLSLLCDDGVEESAHPSIQHAHPDLLNFSVVVDSVCGIGFGFLSEAEGQVFKFEVSAIIYTLMGFKSTVHG